MKLAVKIGKKELRIANSATGSNLGKFPMDIFAFKTMGVRYGSEISALESSSLGSK